MSAWAVGWSRMTLTRPVNPIQRYPSWRSVMAIEMRGSRSRLAGQRRPMALLMTS
jgi:hypothetical protein